MSKAFFKTTIWQERLQDPGLFTWDLKTDLIFADSALASLFGIDPFDAEHGLPLMAYMARVHPEDAPTLAKQISDAIIAEYPTEQSYRVLNGDGVYVAVKAYGRCFRDKDDTPVHYAGIVIPDI